MQLKIGFIADKQTIQNKSTPNIDWKFMGCALTFIHFLTQFVAPPLGKVYFMFLEFYTIIPI